MGPKDDIILILIVALFLSVIKNIVEYIDDSKSSIILNGIMRMVTNYSFREDYHFTNTHLKARELYVVCETFISTHKNNTPDIFHRYKRISLMIMDECVDYMRHSERSTADKKLNGDNILRIYDGLNGARIKY